MDSPNTPGLKKTALEEDLLKRKKILEEKTKSFSGQVEDTITDIVIVGGVAAAAYFIVNQLVGSEKKKLKNNLKTGKENEKEEALAQHNHIYSTFSWVAETVAMQAVVALLSVAKDKLAEYIQSKKSES